MLLFRLLLCVAGMQLTACQLHSSAGRKDFESRAPDYVINQALMGCEPANEFSAAQILERSFYETHEWAVAEEAEQVELLKKLPAQICYYQFANHSEWETYKNYFLEKLN